MIQLNNSSEVNCPPWQIGTGYSGQVLPVQLLGLANVANSGVIMIVYARSNYFINFSRSVSVRVERNTMDVKFPP